MSPLRRIYHEVADREWGNPPQRRMVYHLWMAAVVVLIGLATVLTGLNIITKGR